MKFYLFFIEELSILLQSGLSLVEAVGCLREQTEVSLRKKSLNYRSEQTNLNFLQHLENNLRAGNSLCASLNMQGKGLAKSNSSSSKSERSIPKIFTEIINIGELSGRLEENLKELAKYLRRQKDFKTKIVSTLIYPALILGSIGVISLVVVFFVIPSFQEIYLENQLEVPFVTQTIFFLAEVFREYFLKFILVLCAIFFLFWGIKRDFLNGVKEAFKKVIFLVPLLKELQRQVILEQFFFRLEMLVKAGFTIHEAFAIIENDSSTNSKQNSQYKNSIKIIYQKIRAGESLATSIDGIPLFSELDRHLLRVGEISGRLEEVFSKLRLLYQKKIEQYLENFHKVLEPGLVIILGIFVGVFLVALYLPLFRLGEFANAF